MICWGVAINLFELLRNENGPPNKLDEDVNYEEIKDEEPAGFHCLWFVVRGLRLLVVRLM